MPRQPESLNSFHAASLSTLEGVGTLFFESLTTEQIRSYPEETQEKLGKELSLFFSAIFTDKRDWDYMVRHFFYRPRENTIRQVIFVKDRQGALIALCAFDHGVFMVDNRELSLIYIHIRAILPKFQKHGIGRLFSESILHTLKPDILMTTCVQLASLYSWIKTESSEIKREYSCFPRTEIISGMEKTIHIPYDEIAFILNCFRLIYRSHVKEDQDRLENVVNNITVHLVRKGVTACFDYLKWSENGHKSKIARDLGITENDSVLLVIKKKSI